MECAFEACTCPVDAGDDHCGVTCRLGVGTGAEPCKCGHDACSATIGEAKPDHTRPGG